MLPVPPAHLNFEPDGLRGGVLPETFGYGPSPADETPMDASPPGEPPPPPLPGEPDADDQEPTHPDMGRSRRARKKPNFLDMGTSKADRLWRSSAYAMSVAASARRLLPIIALAAERDHISPAPRPLRAGQTHPGPPRIHLRRHRLGLLGWARDDRLVPASPALTVRLRRHRQRKKKRENNYPKRAPVGPPRRPPSIRPHAAGEQMTQFPQRHPLGYQSPVSSSSLT